MLRKVSLIKWLQYHRHHALKYSVASTLTEASQVAESIPVTTPGPGSPPISWAFVAARREGMYIVILTILILRLN